MRFVTLNFITAVFILSLVASPATAQTYSISGSLPFADDSGASHEVESECKLESKLPGFIESAAKRGITVSITDVPLDEVEGKVLYMEFTHVLGTGGGAWSGPKAVTAHGELREAGEVIGSFTSTRYSTGGAFGGFKGTCSILGRCVKAMGKDIAKWLNNPTMDARLGDAQ
jgi:hypothetical protein